MRESPQRRLLLQAAIASLVLNLAIILMSFLGGSPEGGSVVVRIADAIAAPPGVVAEWAFRPHGHTPGALLAGAAECLACSIAFYAVLALVFLEAVMCVRAGLCKMRGAGA
jgi:hypothetical protein